MSKENPLVLFHPHLPVEARDAARKTLDTRWIGQGPQVTEFERKFQEKFNTHSTVAVGSGTDALHLSYILAGIGKGDEVVAPVFTCTATNIPLLYQGADIKFADIDRDSLNIDPKHASSLITEKTKAVICVDYGGLPCDLDELKEAAHKVGAVVIEDAAHVIGAKYKGEPVGAIADYTIFSFQAIKLITTGDGGMLTIKDKDQIEKAKRIRWFGIDRVAKQGGIWSNDITEIGYKYQMTDISASMGIAALDTIDSHLTHQAMLFDSYREGLMDIPGIKLVNDDKLDRTHSHWMCTVLVENRKDLERKLREQGVECDQVHYRNDRYSIFGGRRDNLPNMDAIEDQYEVLPLHSQMNSADVSMVCDIIRGGW